jgi:hypothetical protein
VTAEIYRARAADCEARAQNENDPWIRSEWENMARWYRRLAEQAARNAETDIVYETPPEQPSQIGQQQQQAQTQKKKDGEGSE